MWWKRKNAKPKRDLTREGVDKLMAFRERGQKFSYLGVTMMVTGHYDIVPTHYGIDVRPILLCDYVDAHGVIHNVSFTLRELPTLERENSKTNQEEADAE